jgi:hypothetical protein
MSEPGMTELANGNLLMVLRNGEWGEPGLQTRSNDAGRTWSKLEKLPAMGVWPTPCLQHGKTQKLRQVSPSVLLK